jgi:superfamily II DNA/RNA helicase
MSLELQHDDVLAAAPCRHLTWLVVDEADRLLRQDYQGWLPYVLQQLPGEPPAGSATPTDGLLGPSLALSSTNRRWAELTKRSAV